MTEILADYLDIYRQYPADSFLTKTERKERYERLTIWEQQFYKAMPTLKEVFEFIEQNNHLKYQKPFFVKVLFPRIKDDIENGNIDGIRFLFDYQETYSYTNNHSRIDFIYIFCYEYPKYETIDLANMLLTVEPNHEKAAAHKYRLLHLWLAFSIHEMPWGILDGKNLDGTGSMTQLYNWLNEFTEISEKLGKDDKKLIEECTILYPAWEQYLDCIGDYNGFKDYLEKQGIAY